MSIDDFGTGYSSLATLRDLLVNAIKIDKSFVASMATDHSNSAIVKATIDLARTLGLETVAEGVEQLLVSDLLRDFGCDTAQGYPISRPLTADVIVDFMLLGIPSGVDLTARCVSQSRASRVTLPAGRANALAARRCRLMYVRDQDWDRAVRDFVGSAPYNFAVFEDFLTPDALTSVSEQISLGGATSRVRSRALRSSTSSSWSAPLAHSRSSYRQCYGVMSWRGAGRS